MKASHLKFINHCFLFLAGLAMNLAAACYRGVPSPAVSVYKWYQTTKK